MRIVPACEPRHARCKPELEDAKIYNMHNAHLFNPEVLEIKNGNRQVGFAIASRRKMAPLSTFLLAALLAAEVFGVPTAGKERRQATLPSYVTTYGEFYNHFSKQYLSNY